MSRPPSGHCDIARPLYARVLRLRHLHIGGLLCFLYLEGSLALGGLLVLAELVPWWGVLALPASVAFVVKINDVLAGGLWLDHRGSDRGREVRSVSGGPGAHTRRGVRRAAGQRSAESPTRWSGAHQLGMAQSGVHQSDPHRSSTHQPGMPEPGAQQPGAQQDGPPAGMEPAGGWPFEKQRPGMAPGRVFPSMGMGEESVERRPGRPAVEMNGWPRGDVTGRPAAEGNGRPRAETTGQSDRRSTRARQAAGRRYA